MVIFDLSVIMFNTTFLKNKNEKEKMKIDLEFSLKNNIIPIEYHSFIVSFNTTIQIKILLIGKNVVTDL